MTLSDLEAEVQGYLTLKDLDALRIVLAAVASHDLPGDPVWLMIVGPPSSAKTEFINLLRYADKVKHLSTLTPKTLASGWDSGKRESSFLAKLTDAILALKDLTTVLEMDRHARKEVLAQLREVYDGKFDAAWGTGKYFNWEGRVTLIAGVTPAIHKYWSVMSSLGPRFLFVQPEGADRQAVAARALENADISEPRMALAQRAAVWLRELSPVNPVVPENQFKEIVEAADLVTRARSAIDRDSRTREVEWFGEPEMPARVAKQLHILARGLARIEGRAETNQDDMRRIRRVGLDTIPPVRRRLMEALLGGTRNIDQLVASCAGMSDTTIRRTAEELGLLGLLVHEEPFFTLKPEWHACFAGLVQETVEAGTAGAGIPVQEDRAA